MAEHVVFFDGVCNFCNGAVNFIIDRDDKAQLKFASLQSDEARALLGKHGAESFVDDLNTIVFLSDGSVYTKSGAALRIAKYLGLPWSLGVVFLLIPSFLRDWAYSIVARNRYRWFGRRDECRVPTPEIRARFL